MVLHKSGQKYYQASVPYLEDILGQSITADLKYGQTWSLLGYKGAHNPIPHWRSSVRRNTGYGPSVIASLVTLRQGKIILYDIAKISQCRVLSNLS